MTVFEGLKDSRLYELSRSVNVAQFVSFGSGRDEVRHFAIKGVTEVRNLHEGLTKLLGAAPEGSINLRTFRPNSERGNEFKTGIARTDEAISQVRSFQDSGLYVIANESINVNGGGVSGVRWKNLVEFAPRDTPRCVEKPGTAALESRVADEVFSIVYGTKMPIPDLEDGMRLEFSLHTRPVGLRGELGVCWEISRESPHGVFESPRPEWPNLFSEFVGDKAYGLLLAHVYGFRVPRTLVMPRDLPPFEFGVATGGKPVWTRTAPRRFAAGLFPTVRGYTDPFRMMAEADPLGDEIGSILVQDGVDASASGAVSLTNGRDPSVYGVRGYGDEFMVGSKEADHLLSKVEGNARRTYEELARFFGAVRFEWVVDRRQRLWVVQLNRDPGGGFDMLSTRASRWVEFDPSEGVESLTRLIREIRGSSTGVLLKRAVGLTSHIGDLLRAASIPVRMPQVAEQLQLW